MTPVNAPFERLLSTAEALAVFDTPAVVQAMLDVEAALAGAQAAEGLMSDDMAAAIGNACVVERYDLDALLADGARAGSLAIPLAKALTQVVAESHADAAARVHLGATSQDVIDTAMVLCTRRALALVDTSIAALTSDLLALAERHIDTPILGRTLLQPAQVVSLGFKLVAWIAPLLRSRERLHRAAGEALQLQLGGAVGTLASMGWSGPNVARRMADDLGLVTRRAGAQGAWHTQRDAWVVLGCEVGVLCGSLGKIGTDLALLSQAEVGELAEPSAQGKGGSSAMPHKRNPVAAMVARAAALRAPHRVAALLASMPQEHERGLGGWQAELAEWPALWIGAHGSAHALAGISAGIEVDGVRMRANIDALQGLVFSEALAAVLAPVVGKARASELVEGWSKRAISERSGLQQIATEAVAHDATLAPRLDAHDIARGFDVDGAARQAGAVARLQLEALKATHARLAEASRNPTAGTHG